MRKLGEIFCVTCLIRFPKTDKNEEKLRSFSRTLKLKEKTNTSQRKLFMSSPPEQSHYEDEIVVCPRMASNESQ